MLILEGKFGPHVKLSYRKRKSSEIMVYSELHGDQEGNGLFVGGRGQNKARVAERRGIGCFFFIVFFYFSFINVFSLDFFIFRVIYG